MNAQSLRMPGATLITRLRVYDTLAPDGQRGGTPHMHFLCSEMYFVLSGHGAVEMIDMNGFSRVALAPHDALVFTPGTIHRLINPDKDLTLLVVMQNSGLPERGDNVVCFPDDIMTDDTRYQNAMRVTTLQDAYQRRDSGVQGFTHLKESFEQSLHEGQTALELFYARARERTQVLQGEWREVIRQGAQAEVRASLTQLAALEAKSTAYLTQSQHALMPADAFKTPGFCGHLNRYVDPATLELEGLLTGVS